MLMRIVWLWLTKSKTHLANKVSLAASAKKLFREKAETCPSQSHVRSAVVP